MEQTDELEKRVLGRSEVITKFCDWYEGGAAFSPGPGDYSRAAPAEEGAVDAAALVREKCAAAVQAVAAQISGSTVKAEVLRNLVYDVYGRGIKPGQFRLLMAAESLPETVRLLGITSAHIVTLALEEFNSRLEDYLKKNPVEVLAEDYERA
jgi:hypothetical protein